MADDQMPPSLQESILTALVFDEKHGALIAAQVRPEHFDDPYNDIADRVLTYRRNHSKPPGVAHLDDLFATELQSRSAPKLRKILFGLAGQSEGLNAEYVAASTQDFIRRQKLKAAIWRACELYQQGGEELVTNVEAVLADALRFRTETMDAGTFLNDTTKGLEFLDSASDGYSLGIEALDRIGIRMVPKEQLLYIAPKNSGKTWFCIHCGKQGIKQGAKVLHITLEFRETLVVARYYQALWAIAQRAERFERSVMELDSLGRFSGFNMERSKPKISYDESDIKKKLRQKLKYRPLKRLVVKEFPTGSLTMTALIGYLDFLEMVHKFIPNILIIDYPDLMKIDTSDYRLKLGRVYEQLRGIAGERNMALITPSQSNRSSLGASRVKGRMVSEDISKVNTADTVLTYSQTEQEHRVRMARLYVDYARNAERGTTILMSQSYATGQYVLDSALMQNVYWERLKQVTGEDVDQDDSSGSD